MRCSVIVLAGFAILAGLIQPCLEARTFSVPGDYSNLEEALREASYGDTVLVGPGRYKVQERMRSGVTLLSRGGPDSTVLWNQRWYILMLIDCDLTTLISGFTFEGRGSNACIACTTGAPSIVDNVIKDSWDGLNLYRSNAFIKGNFVTGCNRAVHLDNSDAELLENEIRRNGDGISMISSSPVIARCRFEHNGRAILILGHSYPTIGGSLDAANDILMNSFTVYNSGLRIEGSQLTDQREVAVATHNYWGSDCPSERRLRGEVVYAPWTDAEHDTLFNECPEQPAPKEGE